MRKLKYIFAFLFIFQNLSFATLHDALVVDINNDWLKKPEKEKMLLVDEVKSLTFANAESLKKLDLKTQYKEFLKDKNYKENYLLASAGYKESENYNIYPFYYKNQKHIYMYALQDKTDLSKIFYYSAMGKLRFIDFIYGKYPEFPYYSIQYKINGEPLSLICFLSNDNQYVYNSDGSFRGLWFKHNMYDTRINIISTRTYY